MPVNFDEAKFQFLCVVIKGRKLQKRGKIRLRVFILLFKFKMCGL